MSRFVSILRGLAPVLACTLLLVVTYNAVTSWLVTRADRTAERQAETGVRVGAEELRLGPADARTVVLLVHGFLGGSSNFGALPEKLAAAGYRVHALRLPGHGTSPREFAETDADELVGHVRAETEAALDAYERVILVGHSMGATLSALTASEFEVDGLVLAAPYFGVAYQWYYVLPAEVWSHLTGWAIDWVYKSAAFERVKRVEARPEIFSYAWVPSEGTRALIAVGNRAFRRDVLENVTCPLLVIHPIEDHAASTSKAERAYEWLGSSDKRLVMLGNSDHVVFYDYEREAVNETIIAFVERVSGQS